MYPENQRKDDPNTRKAYPEGVPKSRIEETGSNPYMIGVAVIGLVLVVLLMLYVFTR